jgi:uncharacterized protein
MNQTMAPLVRRLFLVLVLAGSAVTTGAAGDVPFLAGRVNDTAGLLSREAAGNLEAVLKAHEDSTSNQVAILTIPTLDGEDLEAFSLRVAETWKLGQKGKDNGVLLLIARDERSVRIEVGRGLEGDLPDITCGLIIRREIVPRFRDGDFDGGITAGANAILAAIGGSYAPTNEEDAAPTADLLPRIFAFLIFLVVVGIFTVIGILTSGCQSWFLYVFLIPFWSIFPSVLLNPTAATAAVVCYLVGFPIAKWWVAHSAIGKSLLKQWAPGGRWYGIGGSGGSSSGGGSSSSSGFSGGGGGFSGGGASGGW